MAEVHEGNIDYALNNADFPSNGGSTTTPFGTFKTPEGFLFGWCNGIPAAAVVGFAPHAVVIDTALGAGVLYVNTGTKLSATWTALTIN